MEYPKLRYSNQRTHNAFTEAILERTEIDVLKGIANEYMENDGMAGEWFRVDTEEICQRIQKHIRQGLKND